MLAVSFQTDECEIIGFGGEAYSSDDEVYPSFNDDPVADVDNEEGIEEFRKLTRVNTDFNSVPANLRTDEPVQEGSRGSAAARYNNLKLGKPLLDREGRRETIRVTVEPFQSSPHTTCSPCNTNTIRPSSKAGPLARPQGRSHHREQTDCAGNENQNSEKIGVASRIVSCDLPSTACDIKDNTKNNCTNILKFSLNGGVPRASANGLQRKANDESGSRIENGSPEKSKIEVDVTEEAEVCSLTGVRIDQVRIISATHMETSVDMPLEHRTPTAQTVAQSKVELSDEKCHQRSPKKDSNPICLPLIACKTLQIDLDKPTDDQTAIGEADESANSECSLHPPSSSSSTSMTIECHLSKSIASETPPICASPQPSFLHKFGKDKSRTAANVVTSTDVPVAERAVLSEKMATTPTIPEIKVSQIT